MKSRKDLDEQMNELKIKNWDASEFLENQDDINAYLQVAFESGDPRQITKALGSAAKAQGMHIDSLGYQLSVVPKIKNRI